MKKSFALVVILFSLCLMACEKPQTEKVDQWMGKWIGPEGTYLILAKRDDKKYDVNIQSLDYLINYAGHVEGDHIEFRRNKKMEKITAGVGTETGMKWLQDKKNCLIIQQGEAFCRK